MTRCAWDKAACTEELQAACCGKQCFKGARHIAMEVGADAVLMNTPTAEAQDYTKVAEAMKVAIEVDGWRMTRRLYVNASSPSTGTTNSCI